MLEQFKTTKAIKEEYNRKIFFTLDAQTLGVKNDKIYT